MRTRYEASIEKRWAVDKAEASGQVADSLEVRKKLMKQLSSGEKTLEEVQDELRKIKRSAKKHGLKTRQQVWSQS